MASTAALAGSATQEGTERFARAHGAADGYFRRVRGLAFSSVGIGTYLGQTGKVTNERYEQAVIHALASGINVIDTSINYRGQGSERAVGRALRHHARRDEVFVVTKGGFLTTDSEDPRGPREYFTEEYLDAGILDHDDVAGGAHAMTPAFLENQLSRSLRNLGVETVDAYLVHNPETQLMAGVPPAEVRVRLGHAFEQMEREIDAGRIRSYGVSTWDGLRVPPEHAAHLGLDVILGLAARAREAVSDRPGPHHFRVVELPFNVAMHEALTSATQPGSGTRVPLLAAARDAGLMVLASASIRQGRVLGNVPTDIHARLGTTRDIEAAIEFARSAPGITTALVGMSSVEHVAENTGLMKARPTRTASLRGFAGPDPPLHTA